MSLNVMLWMLGTLAIGLLLLYLGLRGQRINDHPVCRQCRFDLSGSPARTITCPECGAGLKRPGSVLKGQRRKRPLCLGLGALAVILPTLAIGTVGFALLTGQDVHQWMPLGLLLWEARHADAARGQQVAAEVLKRYQNRGLSQSQEAASIATALDVQGDLARPWATEWGDLIEACRSDGKLKAEDELRFCNQAAVLEWKVRPRVAPGDPIPIVAEVKEARVGSATMLMSMLRLSEAMVDAKPSKPVSTRNRMGLGMIFNAITDDVQVGWLQLCGKGTRMGWGGSSGTAAVLLTCPSDASPGRHTASVKLSLQTKRQTMGNTTWAPPGADDPEIGRRQADLAFVVLPANEPGVEAIEPTEDVRSTMEGLLNPRQVHVTRFTGPIGYGGGDHASLNFSIDGVPMGVAFDVVLRRGKREWPLGQLVSGTLVGDEAGFFGPGMERQRYVQGSLSGFDEESVDVVLRPSLDAARRTLDVEKIYGSEIVYADQLVELQEQNMSRGSRVKARKSTSDEGTSKKETEDAPAPEGGPGLFKSLEKLMWPW